MLYNEFMFRIMTGSIIASIGVILLILGIVEQSVSLIFSITLIALGIVILLNKKEDEIEQIKSNKQIHHE